MDKTKIKPLNKDQIIISLDRLTRFKDPEVKYLRVFFDIITSNLIEPRYKKSDLEKMDYEEVMILAQKIINYSIDQLSLNFETDYSINQKLYDYEKRVFSVSTDTEKLLKNKINYVAALELFGEDIPKNLEWLKLLATSKDIFADRVNYSLEFPLEQVVIAEGATEEILLPEFAKLCGYDFAKEGVHIISAGGKNQVVKLYYSLAESLKLPIFVLLDKDAKENLEEISPRLRPQDKIHLVKCGEFEDMLPKSLIKRTLEQELKNISIIESDILNLPMSNVEILEEVFRTRGRHEFKKAEFARLVKNNVKTEDDISPEIREIVEEISAQGSRIKNIK